MSSMNFRFIDVDTGYDDCASLNSLSKVTGENLIANLSNCIDNLKTNWIGNDAKTHINNLIDVYGALILLITDAKKFTAHLGGEFIRQQELRKANGGGGTVGANLDASEPSYKTQEDVVQTPSSECYPEAKTGYTTLTTLCTEYETFMKNFGSLTEDIFENWQVGDQRATYKGTMDQHITDSTTYATYLKNAEEELGKAIKNIENR